jgi:indole-3-glycerol phosphate synthase
MPSSRDRRLIGARRGGMFSARMNRLQKILDVKQGEVAKILPRIEHLRAAALARDDFRSFFRAIDQGPEGLGLIAEVKKASPSVGTIVENFDPVKIAEAYEAAGAHAISVLTDEQFFQGHLSYLHQIRSATRLPCLRKDFMIHEAQIFEASVAGADAILLIVAALEQERLEALYKAAELCQLDVLVEVHTLEELDRALDLGAKIIGINNRNLTTFEVDLKATEEISEEVPEGIILVSESGLKTGADAQRVFDAGCNAILVGETLMRTGNVEAQVAELLGVRG